MNRAADESTATGRLELASGLTAELHGALADGERALSADGDLLASRQAFERAYQVAELAGDVPAMAVAALGLAGLWVSERRTVTGSVLLEARLQQVLSQLDPGSSLALRIRARLAGEADYGSGEHGRIMAVLAEARASGDPVALAEALSLAHHCLLGPDDVGLRGELAAELIKASFRTGRRSDQLMGLLWQTVDSYSAGNPHAGRLLSELRDQLSQRDHPAVGFVVSAIDVMLAIRAGKLEDAETLTARCARNGAAAGDIDSEWWPGGQLVTIRWYQGRLVELLPMLSERVGSPALSAVDNSAVAALAVAAALSGDVHSAASCLAALRGGDLARLPRSSSWLVTMNGITEAAYLLDDSATAARAYELLSPYARLPMVGGIGITCFGSVQQALGVASLTSHHPDQAVHHLRAAVEHNLALGHWPALVSSRLRLARAHALRGQAGDEEAAAREIAAAGAEAIALGIPGPASGTVAAAPAAGTRPAGPATAAVDSSGPATCTRVGRKWRVTWQGRSILVEDSIGVLHLAVLIANPRHDIPAADLVAGLAVLGGHAADAAASQPVLDQQAVGDYRQRLARLDAELRALDTAGTAGTSGTGGSAIAAGGAETAERARLRAEREWLLGQLASAAGLSGRTRSFPDEGERARVAAGKAIRRALARISEADAAIGEHLRQTVHTGTRCSYWPG
jgi:hypothetical protein